MGTVDPSKSHAPTVPCARTLDELHAEYKAYSLLRKKDQLESNLEAGTPAFIVSAKWLKKYHAFILFDHFDGGGAPAGAGLNEATHFTEMHPGPMTSHEDLCEVDEKGENIYGTGALEGKGFEAEHLDAYIDTKHTSRTGSYLIVNKAVFDHLNERYGGQSITRYYIKRNMSYYSEVEVHLNQVRTQFLNAQ